MILNKSKKIVILVNLLIVVLIFGCARFKPIQESYNSYSKGKFKETESSLKFYVETEKAMKNPSYPLMLLILADAQFRLGNYQSACKSYDAAIKSMQAKLSSLESGTSFLKSETNRPYRGSPHEFAFAHYYKGICFFQMEKFNKARIEFAKSRKKDKGEKAGQENDIALVHFMEGLCYEKLGDLNEASVSFRKVTKLKPKFPFSWMKLSFISDKIGDDFNADKYWKKYSELISYNQKLNRNNPECVFLIVDLGHGPYKTPDILTGQFANYRKGVYLENGFELSMDNQQSGTGYQLTDTYFQAKTEGGFAGEAARKVVSVVAKTAVKQIPIIGGIIAGGSQADTRLWYTLSGEVHMAFIPAKGGDEYVINVDYYDTDGNNKKYLERFEQNWYYIPSQSLEQVKPVYLISMKNLHNMNLNHDSISEKVQNFNKKIKN